MTAAARLRVAVFEGTGSQPFEPAVRSELVATLLQSGYAVTIVRAGGAVSQPTAGTLVVVGRFLEPKPDRVDGDVTVYFRDADGLTAPQVAAAVEAARDAAGVPKPGGWKPWFPVIDFDRCTNCMQCLSFCLFDVYGVSPAGKIQVRNESKCKTDCPACSRVCPEVAILFPKYRHGPINGDVVNSDDVRREGMKVDISALLGGDIYQALRDRSAKAKSRFSKERDADKALEERKKCLVKLGEKLDIPAEVLASLPSFDQIRERAADAQAKAQAALTSQP
ncbi:MAG: ferredoxin family protein [Gemmataceae bacterium]